MPVWKLVVKLMMITLLTIVTAYVLAQATYNFVMSSVTLNGLYHEIVNLIGYYKYTDLVHTYDAFLSFLFHCLIFIMYLFIFYQNEKKKHYKQTLLSILKDINVIAEGNFNHPLPESSYSELNEISTKVNLIVKRLKTAMEDERLAEQAKKDLITNVSHDLRTPLTSIIGYLGLIEQDRYKDELELRYYIQIAYEKTNRLHSLINDLFEYTRVQNGGIKLHKGPIDLAEMLTQLSVQFGPQLRETSMECRLVFPDGNIMVDADGNKLARVFENLMSNAIKYGADGKYMDIVVKEDENSTICVEIINYGNAISSIDLPFIFERFYRVEKSRTESDQSSGLGLAISKGIVELHGGRIAVQSDQVRTVFSISLPK
jgi:signal transduction histidine kinase